MRNLARQTQPATLEKLRGLESAGDVRHFTPFDIVNAIAVECTPEAIDIIKTWPEIADIQPDYALEPIEPVNERPERALDEPGTEPNLRSIRADYVWNLGITGAGILVSHLDGGVNGSHPTLAGKWRGSHGYPVGQCWLDLAGSTSFPTDAAGHGSMTMGILCGMAPGDTIGVAWGSWYVAARMNFYNGNTLISTALTAFQWLADPDGNPSTFDDVPRVVSNSWGLEAIAYPECYSVFNTAIDNCEAAGVAVFFAAGNEGNRGAGTIRVPATRADNETNGFAVGAYNEYADSIWQNSSRGPSPCTGDPNLAIKPEITAPGYAIRSAWTGTAYAVSSGTSFASPHAAGVAALMLEANPELTPDSLKKILLLTAVDKGSPGPDNTYGNGHLDAYNAVLGAIGGIGWIAGRVTDPFGYPLDAQISFTDEPYQQTSDSDGRFLFALPAYAPFELRISAPTFVPHVETISLNPGDTLNVNVTLFLQPGTGVLTGTIINCSGGPAAGARIWIPAAGVPDRYANSQGWFWMTVPQGIYDVFASDGWCADGLADHVQIVGQGMTDIEIVLPSNPAHLCSTPDPYGYVICDDTDPGGPSFAWTEIVPSLGGSGIVYNLADDAYIPAALPFPVVLYGQTFNRIFINANGTLSFSRSLADHYNTALPRSCCPALYPFWDDLNDSWGGDICSSYRPDLGQYIIEWSNVPRYDEQGSETFQVVIHDTAVVPVSGGSSVFEVRYGAVSVDYSCTVGIEGTGGSAYRQYVYNGGYAGHAAHLTAGRALRFSDGMVATGTPEFSIVNPNLGAAITPGSTIDTHLVLSNTGTAAVAYAISPVSPSSISSLHWATSDSHDGPPFEFTDISAIGENTGIVRDDTTGDPRDLPWPFPLAGRYWNRFSICSNGYISFTSGMYSQSYFYYPLGDYREPFNIIAPFWTDLDPSRGGAIYTHYDSTQERMMIQWNHIRRYGGSGPNTFQIILYRDGHIELVYEAMSPSLTNCSVGIKGDSVSDFLELAYNQPFVQSNLLVQFARPDTAAVQLQILQSPYGVVSAQSEALIPIRMINRSLVFGLRQFVINLLCSDSAWIPQPIIVTAAVLPDPVGLQTVILPQNGGLRLSWNNLGAQEYCVYGGTPDAPFGFIAATPDTFMWISQPAETVKFFEVRACTGSPMTGREADSGAKTSLTPIIEKHEKINER